MGLDRFSYLLHQIYEGALDDTAWDTTIVELVRDDFNAVGGLDHMVTGNGFDPFFVADNLDLDVLQQTVEYYHTADVNVGFAAVLRAKPCEPFLLESIVDRHTFEYNEGVRHFYHSQKLNKGLFVATGAGPGSHVALFRGRTAKDFSNDEIELLKQLTPHLSRALKLRNMRRKFQSFEDLRSVNAEEASDVAIMIVDRNGRIIETDARARIILRERKGLALQNSKLFSTSKKVGELTEDLHNYLAAPECDQPPFVINRESVQLRLRKFPLPMGVLRRDGSDFKAVVVRIRDLLRDIDFSSFATSYDLTRAERKFLEALALAGNATAAAAHIGITRNTAKMHLSRIFQKVGCENQGQLMLLLGKST